MLDSGSAEVEPVLLVRLSAFVHPEIHLELTVDSAVPVCSAELAGFVALASGSAGLAALLHQTVDCPVQPVSFHFQKALVIQNRRSTKRVAFFV